MRKRIRIRKAASVAAIAMVMCVALAAPASAYEVSGPTGSTKATCDVDARILHNEPQICSGDSYEGVPSEVESSSQSAPSTGTPWAAYSLLGLAIAIAATATALQRHQRHPQVLS